VTTKEGSDDLTLLRRSAAGDGPAFNELMRRHEERIFALALRMTGGRADALDATQEAFISAFRQAGRFRGDSAVSTWLYRIAVNSCHDLLRRNRRFPETKPGEELPERPISHHGVEEQAVLRIDLARALAALQPEYREAVTMHDLGGVPYEEIATATGAALGTVKSRISRGRRQLAKLLEQPPSVGSSKEQT
jgi:RNA polymerase sigma-70 factor (ECF subfamily)